MQRPITLFTGQWADLPFVEICKLAEGWGYDGLEIACWGDHFEVDKALSDDSYIPGRLELLESHHLKVFAISNHLVGQAVCDNPIDERHKKSCPLEYGATASRRGPAAGGRRTQEHRASGKPPRGENGNRLYGLVDLAPVAMFPPVPPQMVERGYADFAQRFNPILDVFDQEGVRFAHEVHPSEIAYDYWTTVAALDAIGHRPAFGLNFDPSHFMWQDLDPVGFLWDFRDRIYHVDCKESKRQLNGRNGRLCSHLPWGDPRRGWDFVRPAMVTCPGRRYPHAQRHRLRRPISIEWEDAGMDRLIGAPEALELTALVEDQPARSRLRRRL